MTMSPSAHYATYCPLPYLDMLAGPGVESRHGVRQWDYSDMRQLSELSLFSGYGGFSLALQLAFGRDYVRTIGYCEIEPYCQEIIKARIKDGLLDDAPIFPDIRSYDGKQYQGLVDIVTAGFPCQPHSVAGKRAGALDDRNLWPDTIRAIDAVGPAIVLLENVPGILANGYAGTVVGELAERGYDAIWGLLSASSVGAPHVRTRWWCLAYANRYRAAKSGWRGDCLRAFLGEIQERRNQEDSQNTSGNVDYRAWWGTEPGMGRMDDGTPYRMDRQKAIGNGIVPAVAAEFLRRIAERVLP